MMLKSASWNWTFLSLCLIAISLDPLFFYIPLVSNAEKCLTFDKKLWIAAIVLRSFLDFFHIIYIIFQMRLSWRYLMRFFPIDLLSILPLPQVVGLIIMRSSKLSSGFDAMSLLKFSLIFQYVPRVIRIYPLFRKARRYSSILAEATWVKAALNLLLYMHASHVFGAVYYFFAVERKMRCWRASCDYYSGCRRVSDYCYEVLADHKSLDEFCSIETQNTGPFDFGIFYDALRVVGETSFPRNFLHCFRWGLQNLSGFGQNLQTSSSGWENIFVIVITIISLVWFVFFIGNMQIYLQSKTQRSEEMRLKLREIEQWMPFQKLPEDIQQQVKKYRQYLWQETKGVDVENLLNSLPKNLKRNIMRHLCLGLLKRVPLFEALDEQLLDAICDRLKPALYTKDSYIVREGDVVDEMLFIMRGRILCLTNNGRTIFFQEGDFLGEEIIIWAHGYSPSGHLPTSSLTARALTKVEAFALMADDLNSLASKFKRLNNSQVQHAFRFYSTHWRTWAARFIQAAWRRYIRRKLERSRRSEEKRLQDEQAKADEISLNLGATIYAARFAANALRATRRNGNASIREEAPPMLLQKPPEPDFIGEGENKNSPY